MTPMEQHQAAVLSINSQSSTQTARPEEGELHYQPGWRRRIADWLRRALGYRSDASLKEVIEEAIEEHEEQAEEPLAPEEKVMLHNVLSFGETKAADIMTPRSDISAVPQDITLDELKMHLVRQRHTRIPVYEETLDRVTGFLHIKDLLPMIAGDAPFDLKSVTRPLLFVPPSMRITDLLVRMRHSGCHMAIVVDEYGGSDGLVTMENLFEEIVGDIHDEHGQDEEQQQKIVRVGDRTFEVSARIRVDRLEQELGLRLAAAERADEFDTLGGLIFYQLGRVPAKGESIPHASGIRFEILDADPRRVRRVRIHTG